MPSLSMNNEVTTMLCKCALCFVSLIEGKLKLTEVKAPDLVNSLSLSLSSKQNHPALEFHSRMRMKKARPWLAPYWVPTSGNCKTKYFLGFKIFSLQLS